MMIQKFIDDNPTKPNHEIQSVAAELLQGCYEPSDEGVEAEQEIALLQSLARQNFIGLFDLDRQVKNLQAISVGAAQVHGPTRAERPDDSVQTMRQMQPATSSVPVSRNKVPLGRILIVAVAAIALLFAVYSLSKGGVFSDASGRLLDENGLENDNNDLAGSIISFLPGFGTGKDVGGATKSEAKAVSYQELFDGRFSLQGQWFSFVGEVISNEGGGVYIVNVTKDDSEVMGQFMPYKDSISLHVNGTIALQKGDIISFVGQADGAVADESFGSSVQLPKVLADAEDIRLAGE
jgi:hypothetical protein